MAATTFITDLSQMISSIQIYICTFEAIEVINDTVTG